MATEQSPESEPTKSEDDGPNSDDHVSIGDIAELDFSNLNEDPVIQWIRDEIRYASDLPQELLDAEAS